MLVAHLWRILDPPCKNPTPASPQVHRQMHPKGASQRSISSAPFCSASHNQLLLSLLEESSFVCVVEPHVRAGELIKAAIGKITLGIRRTRTSSPVVPILTNGMLSKRSPKSVIGIHAWQSRYFELSPLRITYYEFVLVTEGLPEPVVVRWLRAIVPLPGLATLVLHRRGLEASQSPWLHFVGARGARFHTFERPSRRPRGPCER